MNPTTILNQYIKVQVITQRAKQLKQGARPRVPAAGNKATITARQEVELGLIGYVFDAREIIPAAR